MKDIVKNEVAWHSKQHSPLHLCLLDGIKTFTLLVIWCNENELAGSMWYAAVTGSV